MKMTAHAHALTNVLKVKFKMRKLACATVEKNAPEFKFKTLRIAHACVKRPAPMTCNTLEMEPVVANALLSAQKVKSRTKEHAHALALMIYAKTHWARKMRNASVAALNSVNLVKNKTQILVNAMLVV